MPEYIHLSWTADGSPDGPLRRVHEHLSALIRQLDHHEFAEHHDVLPLHAISARLQQQRGWAHDATALAQLRYALDQSYHLVVNLGGLSEQRSAHELHFELRGMLEALVIWFDLGRDNAIRAKRNARRNARRAERRAAICTERS
jgi:hypothetical protein